MNIASSVGSAVDGVDFGFLSSDEIKRLSVKQITNPEVFDNLGHPVAGGLYDLALGAFFKNLCATCGLDDRYCMGHLGHIDLPIPLYNPLFFSHMYMMLRSACLYCHKFRLRAQETHLFACKLRLLQYGLLLEASQLDDIVATAQEELSNGTEVEETVVDDNLVAKRTGFVERAISEAISEGRTGKGGVRTPTILEERKTLIKDFYQRLLSRPKCDNCGMYSPRFRKDGFTKIFEVALSERQVNHNKVKGIERQSMVFSSEGKANGEDTVAPEEQDGPMVHNLPKAKGQNGSRFVLSTEISNILRAVFRKEQPVCKVLFQMNPLDKDYVSADMFFVYKVVVPPTRFRLPSQLGDEVHTNPMNELLAKILQSCLRIRDLSDDIYQMQVNKQDGEQRRLLFTQLMNQFVTLQSDFNAVIDSTKSQTQAGKTALPGIKQALERKEGLFRKNMMGKRVNYAARSVISPDPNLETNEIGIPPVFAVKLTYPEPVTAHNFEEMRQAVIRGPDVWPGATMIQNEDGSQVSLHNMTLEQRTALANQLQTPSARNQLQNSGVNKKVFRHIRNQDVVLMNRQPTLHKASMMGHSVRVLPKEKTLRLHYANTGAYNADFDGDEMNMHFPQNEAARAEALLIANTNSQYLTPTSGKPLRGLIQDHISAGVWLTNKDTYFTREEFNQLVYGSVRPENGQFASDRVLLVPPAIQKPVPLWTGKQVISTILLNIRPAGRPGLNLTSKNKIKNEYWGPHSEENKVLFQDGELLCGILDKSQHGAADHGLVHAIHEIYGADIAGLLLSVLGRLFTKYIMETAFTCGMDDLRLTEEGDEWRRELLKQTTDVGLQAAVEVTNMEAGTTEGNRELKTRLEEILRDDNKLGILDAITQSKANAVTTQVVSKCIPAGTEKKFPYNSMQAMALSGAKGSNVNVSQIMCGLGQQALEGRRVPVMVSGKTLPSFKPFETNVRAGGYIAGRFYSGIKPQEYYFHCMAGREGLIDTAVKTSRSGYLQRCLIKQLEGVTTNYDNTIRDSDGTMIQFMYGGDSIDVVKESYLKEFEFCRDNYESLLLKHSPEWAGELNDSDAISYAKKVRKYLKKNPDGSKYDPVLSKYNPAKYIGSVSEKFQSDLDKYIEDNKESFKAAKLDKKFKSLMQLKYQQSTVNPGENVGIVASQSIGEPSTQMTLNTFHFAGHGAANVTLGIPRMREIIMTASANIKTPQMVLPILENVTDAQADLFAKGITKIMLSQLIDKVVVTERTGSNANGMYVRSYTVRVDLFTRAEYEQEYDVSQHQVEQVLSNKFLLMLENAVLKELSRQKRHENLPSDVGEAVKPAESASGAKSTKKKDDDSLVDDEALEESGQEDEDSDYEEDDAKQSERKEAGDVDVGSDNEEEGSGSDMEAEGLESDDDEEKMKVDEKPAPQETSVATVATRSEKDRQQAVISMHRTVRKFNFDDESGEWCEFELEYPAETKKLLMVNLIEEVCRRCVVREIPNIERCVRPANHKDGRVLVTEGVNFSAMWNEELFIDVNGILSNDVAAVLSTYGVEAARATIVREISNVFETYAIAVNTRHLDLIADMMTREGTYLPFSRQGLDSGTSPFLKMSFESTCQFLTKAVLDGASDSLESPSSRIVVGRPMCGGTGSFDLLTRA